MTISKQRLMTLLEFGRTIPVEKRTRLRERCKKFSTPPQMALGLFLDAIDITDRHDIQGRQIF